MKKLLILSLLPLFTVLSFAQKQDWKEKQAFHELVSETLHPTETGNFMPLKNKSADLLAKAEEWQKSQAPAGNEYPELKTDLEKLVKACRDIDGAVKSKKDKTELRKLATVAHNSYHRIVHALPK